MIYARNNIIAPIVEGANPAYAIMNPLAGSFDIIDAGEFKMISECGPDALPAEMAEYMRQRGYIYESAAAQELVNQARWEEFQAEIDSSQVQLLLIPSYGCNLACTYCYQSAQQAAHDIISRETVDAFFAYEEDHFGARQPRPFITLFGGEPLINTRSHRRMIEYIVEKCNAAGLELSVVTNGYDLADYLDILARASVKEIQVTLDGPRDVHDSRRGTRNGKGSFDRIVEGIQAAIDRGMSMNLRTVIDRENMQDLLELASFASDRGWLDLPLERFKTQIGRNYELYDCYAKPQHLISQAELWRDFAALARREELVRKFHRPDFKGIRHLVDTGEMYMASFDTCPAAKTEWVFDLYGNIYGCTASCGREEFKLGSFYPEISLNTGAIGEWQARNVNNIEECRQCAYNVICGGGCGVIAARRTGRIMAPDCRPVQELVETGIKYYQRELCAMSDDSSCANSSARYGSGSGNAAGLPAPVLIEISGDG